MFKGMVLSIIGFLVVMALVIGGTWAYKWYTAPIRGKIEMREQIQGKDFRRYSYEHFYDLYASYESYKDSLQAQYQVLETAEGNQENRVRQNIAALKSQMARVREEYNADSRKAKTAGQFKSWDLPKRLEPYNVNVN